ncbi:MAG: TonB-dependent receptor [Opitutaceae bacterium]|nr:TonB-dependent receptor [Opitutaceae bacterium]
MDASRARTVYGGVVDFDATGFDLDVTANPTANWRIFSSVGRQRTVNSNTAAALETWFLERLPVWQSYPSWANARMPTGSLLIHEAFQTNVYNAYYYDLALKNGSSVENQRQWRANIVSNYRFPAGRLRGWTVGGAVRYRSGAIIGYPLSSVTAPDGQMVTVTDLDRPYRSNDEITWDALLRYEFKLADRLTCKLQLNVRNVFEQNLRVRAAAYSDGGISRYFRQEPRSAMLETTVAF